VVGRQEQAYRKKGRHAKAGWQKRRQECMQVKTSKEAEPGRQTDRLARTDQKRHLGKQESRQAAKQPQPEAGRQACCHADRSRQLGMKAGSGIGRQEEAVRINLAGKGKQGRRNRQVKQQAEAGKGKQAGTHRHETV
jgi:hypothetical protein